MNKPIPKVTSKKVGHYRLRLTTYQTDTRGGMIELLDPNDLSDPVLFEGHFMYRSNAIDQYREIKTQKEAIHWAYVNS